MEGSQVFTSKNIVLETLKKKTVFKTLKKIQFSKHSKGYTVIQYKK